MKKRVLVTGAGGFIGHHLVKYLAATGHSVRGVDIKYPECEASACVYPQYLQGRPDVTPLREGLTLTYRWIESELTRAGRVPELSTVPV